MADIHRIKNIFYLMLLRKHYQIYLMLADSAKSFRVGAASESYSLGFSFDDVKGLGRWNSDAFMEYILSGARALRARRIHLKLADHHRSKRV